MTFHVSKGLSSICKECNLRNKGASGFASFRGKGSYKILIVAEALGAEEARASLPLVGPTGKTVDRIISQAIDPLTNRTVELDGFWYSNVLWCRPNDANEFNQDAWSVVPHCTSNHLDKLIAELKPKVILGTGNTPLQYFTGHTGIDSLRGYVFETKYGIPYIGTYHGAFIMRGNWHLARVVQLDILKALQISREGSSCYHKDKHYVLHPSPGEALSFLEDYKKSGNPPLAFDIETPYGGLSKDELMGGGVTTEDDPSYTIDRISFSYKPYEGITVPWTPPYDQFAKSLLSLEGMKLVWNEAFDVPRLMMNGVMFNGTICDVMHAWHFLEPSLPMGLKYVSTFLCPDMPAWKLMSREEPEWYSTADSDTLLRCYLSIRSSLERQERWSQFERHFLSLKTLLNKMTLRGINVDHIRRQNEYSKLEDNFKAAVGSLQPRVPVEVLPIHPKKGYKKEKEALIKAGNWVEGRMSLRTFEISEEEFNKIEEKRLKKETKMREKEEKRLARERKKAERLAVKEEKERRKAATNNDHRLVRRIARSARVEE